MLKRVTGHGSNTVSSARIIFAIAMGCVLLSECVISSSQHRLRRERKTGRPDKATRISQNVVYKTNAYLVRIIILILNLTLSFVTKGSRTTIMSYNSKVTFGTLCDGYFAMGNACLNETRLLFPLSFTGVRSPRLH